MHLVEHVLRGRHSIDLVGCDCCGIVADANSAAAWLHLGPLMTTDSVGASLVEGFDFCSPACAAERLGGLLAEAAAPAAPA